MSECQKRSFTNTLRFAWHVYRTFISSIAVDRQTWCQHFQDNVLLIVIYVQCYDTKFTQNEVRFGEVISGLDKQLVARGCSVTFCTKLKGFFHFLSAHFISIGHGDVSCNSCTIPTDLHNGYIEINIRDKLHSFGALRVCIHSISHVWLWVALHLQRTKKKKIVVLLVTYRVACEL